MRFASLFVISFLVDFWIVQALGAAYLLFISGKNLYDRFKKKEPETSDASAQNGKRLVRQEIRSLNKHLKKNFG